MPVDQDKKSSHKTVIIIVLVTFIILEALLLVSYAASNKATKNIPLVENPIKNPVNENLVTSAPQNTNPSEPKKIREPNPPQIVATCYDMTAEIVEDEYICSVFGNQMYLQKLIIRYPDASQKEIYRTHANLETKLSPVEKADCDESYVHVIKPEKVLWKEPCGTILFETDIWQTTIGYFYNINKGETILYSNSFEPSKVNDGLDYIVDYATSEFDPDIYAIFESEDNYLRVEPYGNTRVRLGNINEPNKLKTIWPIDEPEGSTWDLWGIVNDLKFINADELYFTTTYRNDILENPYMSPEHYPIPYLNKEYIYNMKSEEIKDVTPSN